jgi:hypothetical protein
MKIFGRPMLDSVLKVMDPDGGHPLTVAVQWRSLRCLCECSPTLPRKRIASGKTAARRNAPSAWRSMKLASHWSDWNVYANFTKDALWNGLSGGKSAPCIKSLKRSFICFFFGIFIIPSFWVIAHCLILAVWRWLRICVSIPWWILFSQPFERAFISISSVGNRRGGVLCLYGGIFCTITCHTMFYTYILRSH